MTKAVFLIVLAVSSPDVTVELLNASVLLEPKSKRCLTAVHFLVYENQADKNLLS
jgi:hypothetical protein